MSNAEEQFTPETVDERIEHHLLEENRQRSHVSISPKAQLIQSLYEMYEGDAHALDRVRMRLAEYVRQDTYRYNRHEQSLLLEPVHQRQRGPQTMKSNIDEKKSLKQHLTVLVATILVAALIGSFALMLHMTHQTKTAGQLISGQKGVTYDQSGMYAFTFDGVYRVNMTNGKIVWHFFLDPADGSNTAERNTVDSVLAVSNGIIYFGGRDGQDHYLYALHTADGKLVWKKAMEVHTLQVTNGVIYADIGIQYDNDTLSALDATTGALRWSAPIKNVSSIGGIQNNVLYVSALHTLYALNTTDGSLRWSTNTATDQVFMQVHLVGDTIYIGSYNMPQKRVGEPEDCYAYAFNATNGQLLWTSQVVHRWISDITIANDMVYFNSDDGYTYALAASNGVAHWKNMTHSSTLPSSPQPANGALYTHEASYNAPTHLLALNAFTGAPLWSHLFHNLVDMSPIIVSGSLLYYGGTDGAIHAISISDGTQVAQYQLMQTNEYSGTSVDFIMVTP